MSLIRIIEWVSCDNVESRWKCLGFVKVWPRGRQRWSWPRSLLNRCRVFDIVDE
jgi:hypothetical protein